MYPKMFIKEHQQRRLEKKELFNESQRGTFLSVLFVMNAGSASEQLANLGMPKYTITSVFYLAVPLSCP
jgi:hypothetical protein